MKKLLWLFMPLLLLLTCATPTHASTRLGFDVSSYQDSSYQFMQHKAHQGAKFVIVKLGGSGGGEGYNYQNYKASAQLMNGQKAGLAVGGYYWGQFGASKYQARDYARLAINSAKKFGLRKGSFLALDYELGASWSVYQNTNAIIVFMHYIKSHGYHPFLYSGSSYMKSYIDYGKIARKFGNVLWIANYKTTNQQYSPDFHYFPSMSHVAMWQFADNWYHVDGSIEFLKHKTTKKVVKGKAKKNVVVTKTTTNKAKKHAKTYTVRSGDSWYSIALKYGMDMHQLAQLNHKTIRSMIHPKDKLKLTGTLKNAAKPVKQVTKKYTHSYKHKVKINYVSGHHNWAIRLLDNKGHYTNHYVRPRSRYQTHKVKKFSKGTAYLIGKNLWVLAKYTTIY